MIHSSRSFIVFLLCLLALFQWSCASYLLDETQDTIRQHMDIGDYDAAIVELQEAQKKGIYKDKDQILWLLEMGMLHHYNGEFSKSNEFFRSAELAIEQAFTKSISRGAYALVGNDNQLVYDSEPYEEFYLHAFKALNYLESNNNEASLVEIRQMIYKIEQLNIRLNGLSDTYAKQDTSFSGVSWKVDNTRIQNSPFARYLASQLYDFEGNTDGARIEKEQFIRAIYEHYSLIEKPLEDNRNRIISELYPEFPNGRDVKKVLAFTFTGRSPIKIQEDFRIYNEHWETELKFSLPILYPQLSQVSRIEIWNDDEFLGETILLESMHAVAEEVYRSKIPIIYGRAVLRAIAKFSGSNWIENLANEDQKLLGNILDVASFIYKEGSEKADLRAWSSLSGNVYVLTLYLPTGENKLYVHYYDHKDGLLYEEEKTVSINENETLNVVEFYLAY